MDDSNTDFCSLLCSKLYQNLREIESIEEKSKESRALREETHCRIKSLESVTKRRTVFSITTTHMREIVVGLGFSFSRFFPSLAFY
jgi:hypothetical protein